MSDAETSNLDFGDIVEHRIFGVGKIIDIDGKKLTIQFDEDGEKRVLDSFVQRIKSGHEKGIRYWQRKWDELTTEWKLARSKVDTLIPRLFRPQTDEQSLDDLLSQLTEFEAMERSARKHIELFLEEEAAFKHK